MPHLSPLAQRYHWRSELAGTRLIVAALLAAATISFSLYAAAEDVPLVDGVMWKKSAPVLKRAYLVGMSNLLSSEYAVQQAFGPPPDSQTAGVRLPICRACKNCWRNDSCCFIFTVGADSGSNKTGMKTTLLISPIIVNTPTGSI